MWPFPGKAGQPLGKDSGAIGPGCQVVPPTPCGCEVRDPSMWLCPLQPQATVLRRPTTRVWFCQVSRGRERGQGPVLSVTVSHYGHKTSPARDRVHCMSARGLVSPSSLRRWGLRLRTSRDWPSAAMGIQNRLARCGSPGSEAPGPSCSTPTAPNAKGTKVNAGPASP